MSRCKTTHKINGVYIIVTASRQVSIREWRSKCECNQPIPFEIEFENRTKTRREVRWSGRINGDPPGVHFAGVAGDRYELSPNEFVLHQWNQRWPVNNLTLEREPNYLGRNQWQEVDVEVEVMDTTIGHPESRTLRIEVKLL